MTEEKCRIKQNNCNKEALKRLTEYQAEEIEHKEPKQHQQFYFTEAIGDIFRELTHHGTCWYAESYIKEKLRKLSNFGVDTGGDEREKCEYYMKNKDQLSSDVKAWHPKLDEFKDVIKKEDVQPCRKDILLQVPEIQQDLIKWGIYYTGTKELKKKIRNFIEDVESRL